MDPYKRQNIFTIATGAFPLFSDITPVYTKRINEGDKHHIDIFRSQVNNIETTERAVLFGNHIFYHYSGISNTPFRGDPTEFLEAFFQKHQENARFRLQAMMRQATTRVVNNAAKLLRSAYTAAPEEAGQSAESERMRAAAKTTGTAAQSTDIYDRYTGKFYEVTKEAANKYAYHHGIFGREKKAMMTEFRLADKNKLLKEHGKNKAKAKAILNYYKGQASATFNPIIRNIRRQISLPRNTPHETLAAEMYGMLSSIKKGANGYPALSALGVIAGEKVSSGYRGKAASIFILHALGNYLAQDNLYHILPIDEKSPHIKAIIGEFAFKMGPRFPEFDISRLTTAEVVSGLFGTVASYHGYSEAGALAENMDRGHQHGMYLLGKTEFDFRRNEIHAVTKENIFSGSKNYRVSMNLVAADKDFSNFLVEMLQSLKTAGSPKALKLLGGGLTPPTLEGFSKQLYWAVPYLGIYDVEYSELKEEV